MRLAAAIAVLALALAGCGDGDASDSTPVDTTTTSGPSTTIGAAPVPTEIDCDVMDDFYRDFETEIDVLVTIRDDGAIAALRAGEIDANPTALREAIVQLRPLAQLENPLGSVAEALDYYDEAATIAETVVAEPGNADAADALLAVVADDATFISTQGIVNFSFGDAGCRGSA